MPVHFSYLLAPRIARLRRVRMIRESYGLGRRKWLGGGKTKERRGITPGGGGFERPPRITSDVFETWSVVAVLKKRVVEEITKSDVCMLAMRE